MLSNTTNPIFELAAQFVNQTTRSVFLTGKAGTGKTTFLKFIRDNSFRKMAVVAPTGVAAINAGGTTLHSFFQLPFGPFIPASLSSISAPPSSASPAWNAGGISYTDPGNLLRNIRFNADKRELLRELELLVIDEVSMVRSDMLDAIDTILRHFRQQPLLPFGGLQVLFIGDLFQLPPIVPDKEKALLDAHYASPFFFDARVFRQAPPVFLELNRIYRQNEARFIQLLNNIRTGSIEPEDMELLRDYYQPDFICPSNENYITLTSHNAKADSINREQLNKLRSPEHAFEASVTGEFNANAYPAEKTLLLKQGAQVMLIKNDKGETRRYYNGKIGTIGQLNADRITLVFPDEPDELILEKENWKNIRYNYNKEKDRVEEEELGSFSQYPIRLAWAITIHKSQGLTFDKAVIDAGASFAPGQVYVALSRLRSLNGLVLLSRISPFSIRTDARVVAFMEEGMPAGALEQHLEEEQLSFISESLRKTFQWARLTEQVKAHYAGYAHRQIPDRADAIRLGKKWIDSVLTQQEKAHRFGIELQSLLSDAASDGYSRLQQQVAAMAAQFGKALEEELIAPLQQHIASSRGKQKTKKYLQELHLLKLECIRKKQQIDEARQLVTGLQKGIDTTRLLMGLQESRATH